MAIMTNREWVGKNHKTKYEDKIASKLECFEVLDEMKGGVQYDSNKKSF